MPKIFRSGLSEQRSQRGAVVVEFAIIIVPLFMLLLGVTEYGRAIYQYNTLIKSVRDAARLLSGVAPGTEHAAARCLVVRGTMDCSGNPVMSNLAQQITDGTAAINICDANSCAATHAAQPTGSGSVNLVTVTVTGFRFQSLFNLELGGFNVGAPDITYDPIQISMRQAS